MHVEAGFWRKVHYNALFGAGKNEKRLSSQSRIPKFRDREQGSLRKDLRKIREEKASNSESPGVSEGALHEVSLG
jgi:hypothetical protein